MTDPANQKLVTSKNRYDPKFVKYDVKNDEFVRKSDDELQNLERKTRNLRSSKAAELERFVQLWERQDPEYQELLSLMLQLSFGDMLEALDGRKKNK